MRIFKYIVFIALLLPLNLFAQSFTTKKTAEGKAKKLFDRGMKYVFNGLDDKAMADFKKVVGIEPTFIDAHLQNIFLKYIIH